jgi:hypothetical protein
VGEKQDVRVVALTVGDPPGLSGRECMRPEERRIDIAEHLGQCFRVVWAYQSKLHDASDGMVTGPDCRPEQQGAERIAVL